MSAPFTPPRSEDLATLHEIDRAALSLGDVGDAPQPRGVPSLPSGPSDPFPGTGPDGSISTVLQVRLEQVEKWGHTAEADGSRDVREFVRQLHDLGRAAEEDHQFHPRDFTRLRKRVARLGALALATIDRIDMEGSDDEQDN